MSTESNDRVLVGAETYIAGPYHFVKGFPQLVRATHIAYIDSLRTVTGEPMFSHVEPEQELEFIDGEELDEVGLGEQEELDEEQGDEPEQDPEVTASMDAMKSENTPAKDPELDQALVDQAPVDEAQVPAKTGKVLKVGKQGTKAPEQKPEDDQTVTV